MGMTYHLQWQVWFMLQKYKKIEKTAQLSIALTDSQNVIYFFLNSLIVFLWVLEHFNDLEVKF